MLELAENFLLDGFVRAWEEVAALRQANAEGRLAAYLADAGSGTNEAGEMSGQEMASRLAARLTLLLEAQVRNTRDFGSEDQRRQQQIALYATTALIDEVFLMEFAWPGREAWLDLLLEYRFFHTRIAGQHFFELLERVLLRQAGGSAQADLAAIFLLALKLGFKGAYRGPQGEAKLRVLRAHLLARTRQNPASADTGHLFPQAYQFQAPGRDARLAPLRPWLRAGGFALLAYVLLSSAIWLAIVQPFISREWGPG
jgi:type VI secretion system protein ImpK